MQQPKQQHQQLDCTNPSRETLSVGTSNNNSSSNNATGSGSIISHTKSTRGASTEPTPPPILLSTSSQHSSGSARERRRLLSSGNSNSNSINSNNNKSINSSSDHNLLLNGSSHHSISLSDHISEEFESEHPSKQRRLSDGDLASPSKQSSSNCSSACCLAKMGNWNSTKVLVLVILSLQNSLFTVLRRYSQGVLREDYSKYEVLLAGEIIKMLFSAYVIRKQLLEHTASSNMVEDNSNTGIVTKPDVVARLQYLLQKSGKMVGLALIYGAMNILSFVSLRNIGAGMFTIFAQCKILTTASFSTLLLQRRYSWVKWRALVALIFGVLLFSEPIWGHSENLRSKRADANLLVGVAAVIIEVTLSGFASIYFEKVVKTDPLQLTIWERNFQLAFGSFPVYLAFIAWDGGGTAGFLGGWSLVAVVVTVLGAAGGLLVALSIKYGDAILKTLATTAAIILSSVLDAAFLGGPLTSLMVIAGAQVVISIMNYTFDPTPADVAPVPSDKEIQKGSDRPISSRTTRSHDEEIGLVERKPSVPVSGSFKN